MTALAYLCLALGVWALLRVLGGLATLVVLGPSSSLWSWHRQFRRAPGDPVYMDRWQLFRSPWLDVYLNRINRPDYDDLPHTHPWRRSYSIKLIGAYVEEVWKRYCLHIPGAPNMYYFTRSPSFISRIPETHRIVMLSGDRPCWTLFLGMGRASAWGFIDPATGELARVGGSGSKAS